MVQGILNIPKRDILDDWFVNWFLSSHHQVHGHAKSLQSGPTLCEPWTVAHHVPLSMGFSRQEYWSGLPFPPLGDLSGPGMEPSCPVFPSGGFFTPEPPGKPQGTS